MKKRKTLALLIAVMMFAMQLTGCGSSKAADEPGDEQLKSDVQDYIEEIVDSSGEIKIFEKTECNVDGDEAVAVCTALFSTSSGDQQGEFTLTYSMEKGDWVLDKCKVALEDEDVSASSSKDEDEEEAEEETEAEEPDEETDGSEEASDEDEEKKSSKASSGSRGAGMASTGKTGIVTGYSLEESGSISSSDRLSYSRGVVYYEEDNAAKIVAGNGDVLKESYVGFETIGEGYLVVRKKSNDVNSTGLITTEGEEIIPCEAAIIERMNNKRGDGYGRYLKVIYGTEVTTDKEKALFYTTDKTVSFSADEDDTMYIGYIRVFDLKKKQFVKSVESDNPSSSSMKECGDHFFMEDKEGISYLYDEDGNMLFQSTKVDGVGNGYYIVYDEGVHTVYSEDGEELFDSKDMFYELDSTSGYLRKNVNSNYVLIDQNGEQVLPDPYKYITSEFNGLVSVQAVTGEYQLVTIKGDVLVSSDDYVNDLSNTPYYASTGYYNFKENDKYGIVGPGGEIASGLENNPGHGIAVVDSDALVLNDGEFSLHLENKYYNDLGFALIASKSDANGKYGVFDLFTGEQLLDYEYDDVISGEGYIYAKKGDEYKIYKVNCKYY